MTVPQPIFEVVAAPELAVWSQAAITTFVREQKQYETKIAERCATTGEVQEAVARSIRTSLEPRVLEHVAHYILKKEMDSVTDAMLLAEMKRKIGGMVNDRVPDVSRLFANELKMDLSEVDVEARIARYFMSFDRLVEENGLSGMLGRGSAVGEGGCNGVTRKWLHVATWLHGGFSNVGVRHTNGYTLQTAGLCAFRLPIGR
ncbi:hypothetical protein PI125_g15760 [Phytophthora idaei]|nr:hypothetical protein PI125_g15760 [Phytophthora idaei]KAG3143240.1 hypothetical protein PI126_g14727 [Phytophthora idaei]